MEVQSDRLMAFRTDCLRYDFPLITGWPSVDAYYKGSSSADSIQYITLPVLCIQVRHIHLHGHLSCLVPQTASCREPLKLGWVALIPGSRRSHCSEECHSLRCAGGQ